MKVFLVDDHALFRTGVRHELADHHEVVGEAATVDEAVTRIPLARPDVDRVLMQLHPVSIVAHEQPPLTGGITANSSPSASGVSRLA